jgi:hypothetical protein
VARFLLGLKEDEERRKIFDFCLALLGFFLVDFLMAGIVRLNFVG